MANTKLSQAAPGTGDDMFIPSTELEQGVEYYFRIFPRNHQNQFQTGIDGSQLHIVVQDGNEAEPDDSIPTEITPSYTGNSQIFGDGYKGYIEMYDSGVLTFNTDVTVDMFLVGGGGGGGSYIYSPNSLSYGGGGGGGGYTSLFNNATFSKNDAISVTIGAGGAPGTNGGATSVGSYSVNGGSTPSSSNHAAGGAGGSGGGAGSGRGFSNGAAGGSNGGNGGDTHTGSSYTGTGGTGQGISTYEFLDTQLRLFSGGGGGAGSYEDNNYSAGGAGGAGGGGNGSGVGYGGVGTGGTAGTANTGGGGGGGSRNDSPYTAYAGGSGIAIIRWGDWTTA